MTQHTGPRHAGMLAGAGDAIPGRGASPPSCSRISTGFLAQSALLFANDAADLQEVQSWVFFFFLAICTLPF